MKTKIVLLILCVHMIKSIQFNADADDFPERIYINFSVNPCNDFYEYTCGNFKKVYPLDNDTLTIDHFTVLEDKILKIANEIFSENNFIDDPEALNKSKSAYKACVDTNYLDKVKNPEKTIVEAENGFPLIQELAIRKTTKFGFNNIGDVVSKYGIPMLFNLMVTRNANNATKNSIYIYPLEISSLTPQQIRPHREKSYDEAIEKGFSELSKSPVRSTLKPFDFFLRNMTLKIRNAAQSTLGDQEVFGNIELMNNFTRTLFLGGIIGNANITDFKENIINLRQLNSWTKAMFNNTIKLDWVEFLRRYFANSGADISENTEVLNYIGFPKILYGIINLVGQTEEHVVKSYTMMRLFTYLAPESDASSRQYLENYFRSQNYVILPRWKYCTRKLIDSVGTAGLSFTAAYEYQLRHFNVNYFSDVVELIENIQSSFKEILQNSSWMDDSSKAAALQKFDNLITILGHPDISYKRDDLDKFYENLRICKWDNYGNSIRINAFKNAYQISQIAKGDREFWDKSPFEINAYYNAPNNKITFPISMLNPVFFGNKNKVLDYGRIGTIIGHEITHGFDTKGMMYGPDGTLQKWWTNETSKAFYNKTACFVVEYDHFNISEIQEHVNGTKTLNENIADNGGVRESYLAMKKMVKKYNLKGTKEFTPEQLFFIGFGTLWCSNPSVKYLEQMKLDEHTISKYRVNGVVSNVVEFSEAFSCPPGSNMNPTNKCLLW